MPTHPKHACGARGCPALVARGVARCEEHQAKHRRVVESERGSASERGYDRRWAAARVRFLREHPLCATCLSAGRVTAGRVVDHVVPHRGDPRLFWDESNWQTLCDYTSPFNCHGKKTGSGA